MASLASKAKSFVIVTMLVVLVTSVMMGMSIATADEVDARQAGCFYGEERIRSHIGWLSFSTHYVEYMGPIGPSGLGEFSYYHTGYRNGNFLEGQEYFYVLDCV